MLNGYNYVADDSKNIKNSRKRLSSESLPILDPNTCNGSKKSKLESKAIIALVAYGSDSSDDENEVKEDQKSTILQRLQQKAEMFKQKEINKLTKTESSGSYETNDQPDIFDIIDKEVPPDYVIEKANISKSLDKKSTDDICNVLKSEDHDVDDTINNNTEKENISIGLSDSTVKIQPKMIENDKLKYSSIDEKTKCTTSDSLKDSSLKSFNLIANYDEEENLNSSGKQSFILFK